ncbi:MAG: acyl-CoA dehydrogenase family protein [Ilumatobacter sp.]|uniref:acyl-CoA dehydrogenase family protein n=1 Tax=Ilumatobacter sp. TaxID=1967498 RepID=UPI002615F8A4|nr:acyl-CoA dehydrogenase family protein [Ilumatobacter sp.]MDJ0768397.1 acyl-CoA dehydrogenase family protein [Ilumatobacter sp.]
MGSLSGTAIERAAEVARANADLAERERRLPAETVAALAEAGMFTLCLPTAYDGPGTGPLRMIDAVLEVARADGSAGWCSGIASTTASLAAFLEPDVARKIFTSPATASGGVFAPNGHGVRVGDGYRVTGRWQWGSGTQHCEWIVGGAMCDDDTQRVCFFPAADVDFHDTWHTSGMRGTGSLDISVDDVHVPEDHTIQPGVSGVHVDEPLAHFPNFTLLALGVAATGLGVARRALDELAELAGAKTPQFSSRTLAASGFAQSEFSRAEARWRSARAYLRAEVGDAWEAAVAGESVPVEARVAMRLAAAHAAAESVAAVDAAWTLAGGTAVYDTSVLGRCLRDVHVVTQHIMVAPKLNETLGKYLLGQEFNAAMI